MTPLSNIDGPLNKPAVHEGPHDINSDCIDAEHNQTANHLLHVKSTVSCHLHQKLQYLCLVMSKSTYKSH